MLTTVARYSNIPNKHIYSEAKINKFGIQCTYIPGLVVMMDFWLQVATIQLR